MHAIVTGGALLLVLAGWLWGPDTRDGLDWARRNDGISPGIGFGPGSGLGPRGGNDRGDAERAAQAESARITAP
ncbi:hypothetical protein FF36_03747 [Frankia torreyi]|uniref:Uncharacterized protein n=1 Tax=Frankia torreyi TaxID=1856 RepID=A0A0D8BDE6_9ACTN|nr:hypothetical protein [Frankia sp. CpI1-P]KJE21994.1 hypothetical protein FF36_03747 [Frankia torreyi]KQM04008.1 hypothetical protein FF86_103113 [Frankia sp. CpI1-P]